MIASAKFSPVGSEPQLSRMIGKIYSKFRLCSSQLFMCLSGRPGKISVHHGLRKEECPEHGRPTFHLARGLKPQYHGSFIVKGKFSIECFILVGIHFGIVEKMPARTKIFSDFPPITQPLKNSSKDSEKPALITFHPPTIPDRTARGDSQFHQAASSLSSSSF
jgi:hypothetical protein